MSFHIAEPFLSVIGGGTAAAIVTCAFQLWSDKRRQKQAEDWEFRQHRANQIEAANSGLMEVFFTAKANLYFMVCSLEVLNGNLERLATQADAIVRQQLGVAVTQEVLEKRKHDLLQPFLEFNQEQVRLRLWQYEQESKLAQSKAEQHIFFITESCAA